MSKRKDTIQKEAVRTYCAWATDDLLRSYHDEEWGTCPKTDEGWFESLVLETFQAGLSWRTILHKREGFREAFQGFSVQAVANFTNEDVARLLNDPQIVRNRRKVLAAVENAQIAVGLKKEFGTLQQYFLPLSKLSRDEMLSELQRRFSAVGKVTGESLAFATGLLPVVHDPNCWKTAKGKK